MEVPGLDFDADDIVRTMPVSVSEGTSGMAVLLKDGSTRIVHGRQIAQVLNAMNRVKKGTPGG
jgi:hypothetical protein